MILYDFKTKEPTTDYNASYCGFISPKEAENLESINTNKHFTHNDEDFFLNFIFFHNDSYESVKVYLDTQRILIISDFEDVFMNEITKMIHDTSKFNTLSTQVITYFSELNFESLSTLEETMMTLEKDINDNKDIQSNRLISYKGTCLMMSKQARKNLFTSEALINFNHPLLKEKDQQHFNLLATSLYEYSLHLIDYSTHLVDSNKMRIQENTNTIINRLTLVTVFVTPFTVISGIYGMNFLNMPGLDHPYGYVIIMVSMILISFLIYVLFKIKKLL